VLTREATAGARGHAIVTGGSSGIGLATARRLAARGRGVTLVARRPEPLAAAAEQVRAAAPGATVRTLALDVADGPRVAEALAAELAEQPAAVLVNAAGTSAPQTFLDTPAAELRRQMDVNHFGAVWTTRAVVPHLVGRGGGHVVNVASVGAVIGLYGYSAYSPSKFALLGLSEVLRTELAPLGIRVSVVLPGNTDTPMLAHERESAPAPTRRLLTQGGVQSPDAVARAIVRGIERGRFEIVPSVPNRATIALYRILPGLVRAVLDRGARDALRAGR